MKGALGLAAGTYAVAGGTLASTRADYRALLGLQGVSVGLLLWMKYSAFKNDRNLVLHITIAALALSLLGRIISLTAFAAKKKNDINRAAKMNRWDTAATSLAYAATLGFAFRALLPRGILTGKERGALGTAGTVAGVPAAVALGTVVFADADPDEDILQAAAAYSDAAYTRPTHRHAQTDTRVFWVDRGDVFFVAFGGTDSLTNVKTDATVSDVHPPWADPIHPKLRVHAGFAKAWESVRETVLDAVSQKSQRVVCCGHSLGGALATLAALDLSQATPATVECYTFGSPQVGDQLFVDGFRARVAKSIRVFIPLDPIVRSLSLQFVHVHGAYPVSPLFGASLNPHDLDEYIDAVGRPRALGILGLILPVVYVALAIGLVYAREKRRLTPS